MPLGFTVVFCDLEYKGDLFIEGEDTDNITEILGFPERIRCSRRTPRLIGRAVVALVSDSNVIQKAGTLVKIQDRVSECSLTDIDGRQTGEMW